MVRNTLRSLLAEPRPANPPRRVWRDWVLVAVLVVSALLEIALHPEVRANPLPAAALIVVLAFALMWRRRAPLGVVGLMFGVTAVISLATLLGAGAPPLLHSTAWVLVLPYALFRWGSGREAAVGLVVMLASASLGIAADYTSVVETVVGIAVLLFPAELGAAIRYRANARLREIDQVKLREREQLARELHDTVAHHVSAIAILAQAGQTVAATDPQRAAEALAIIEEAASRTLEEMRAMVGVLRDGEEAELAPQPGVADIERLTRGGTDWPHIEVEFSGDLVDLSPSVGAALYRLAQESITNAVRHARHASRVSVRVAGDDDWVRLTVSDDGDTVAADRGSWGYGIIGMTERASLLGGTLEAGPAQDRGWLVRAALPRDGAVS